jgi:hypothetical protein
MIDDDECGAVGGLRIGKGNRSAMLPLLFFFSHGLRLSPLGTAATVWPIVPAPDECEAVGGM